MSSPGGHLLQSRDPAKAGAALTIANDAGADEVSGPSFSLEDQHIAKGEAVRKAIQDARAGRRRRTGDGLSKSPVSCRSPRRTHRQS